MNVFFFAALGALIAGHIAFAQDLVSRDSRRLTESVDDLPIRTQLPELMRLNDGTKVDSLEGWHQRRSELRSLLMYYQYGEMPPRPHTVAAVEIRKRKYKHGPGTTESMTLVINAQRQSAPLRMRVLMFLPHDVNERGRCPVIIREEGTLDGNEFVPKLLERGYIFIEYARHDLDPDKKNVVGTAQQAYPDYDWATLSVWAWGGMRVVDYLESRDDVDMSRIGITGHSRGGKMALLAGALDDRISLVVPVQSGAGGAGCYTMLGPGAESLSMNDKPHWYADRIQMFIGHADRLPFDQHFLKALVAPRALLCIESVDDDYANPVGTQLTTIAAEPAFALYGDRTPENNGLIYRNGSHSFSVDDWQALLDFAEWHFRDREPQNANSYRARPYDIPAGWYRPVHSHALRKGIASERVRDDNQAAVGPEGYTQVDAPNKAHAENYYGMGRFGAVDYQFEIAKRQVTNAEYAEFLDAITVTSGQTTALYDPEMKIKHIARSGRSSYSVTDSDADLAVTHVTWYNAVRYCNWLHNGKPKGAAGLGTTESGAYTISGPRNVGPRSRKARFALPTDDEWFKAAYYDPARGYLLYVKSETGDLQVVQHDRAGKSAFGVSGLYDRLWEWTENPVEGLFRSVRSGAWFVGNNRQAAGRLYSNPDLRVPNIGFRVVRLRR